MTIIVTGAAGFIGSNIVKALNQRGETNKISPIATSHIIWTKTNSSTKCADTSARLTTSAPYSTKAHVPTP